MPKETRSDALPEGSALGQIPPEILEKLPEGDRRRVLEVFSAAAMWAGPVPNPVLAKITPQHISDMIALASRNNDLALQDRKHSRIFGAVTLGLIISASLVLLLVLAVRGQNDLIIEVIKLIAIGIGGFGGGYGFARWRGGE